MKSVVHIWSPDRHFKSLVHISTGVKIDTWSHLYAQPKREEWNQRKIGKEIKDRDRREVKSEEEEEIKEKENEREITFEAAAPEGPGEAMTHDST